MDTATRKNPPMIQWLVLRSLFSRKRNCGRQRSSVIRRTSPVTPTNEVSTAPLSTSTASTLTITPSQVPSSLAASTPVSR